MAEFLDVVRQATRMCEYYICGSDLSCEQCPLSRKNVRCGFTLYLDIGNIDDEEAAEIEQVIMAWAAEHPVLRYPTWSEWQKNVFPGAGDDMYPCSFLSYTECGCKRSSCDECRERPIPADIAEKLGIRPINEGCENCKYTDKAEDEEPCVRCRRTQPEGSARWTEMSDLWEEAQNE